MLVSAANMRLKLHKKKQNAATLSQQLQLGLSASGVGKHLLHLRGGLLDQQRTTGTAGGEQIILNQDATTAGGEEQQEHTGGDINLTEIANDTKRRRFVTKTMRMNDLRGNRTVIVNPGCSLLEKSQTTPVALNMSADGGMVKRMEVDIKDAGEKMEDKYNRLNKDVYNN